MNTLTTFFDWLLAASLRASVLALGGCLIQIVLQKHLSPRWRYALWLPVLVVLLMPVQPESRWSAASVFEWRAETVETPSLPVIADAAPSSMPAAMPAPVVKPPVIDWQQTRVIAWAAGAALMLLFGGVSFTRAMIRFRRTRQSMSDQLAASLDEVTREVGLRHRPRVLVSPSIQSPAVTGLLRPVLLLPPGFDRDFIAEEKRLILQHELMHLKRGDLPLNTLLCVLMALHWFNPLLWLAFLKARADREAACDAQVLENATPQRRSAYGHALLKIESAFAPLRLSLGFIGILQRHASLRARIRSIALPTRTRPFTGLLASLCILGMTFLGITRAEKPATKAEVRDSPKFHHMGIGNTFLMSLEVQIISFNRESNWNLGGRLTTPPPGGDKSPTGAALQTQTLGSDELNKLLEDTLQQPGAFQTAYPRMVIEEGEESMVRSVVNQPVPGKNKDGKDSIDYVPIGFAGKFTAKQYSDDKIMLHIEITNSEIIGETKIGGQIYPVARTSAYRASEEVPVGMSCAVYGWQEHGGNKVEAPGRRPVLYIITPKRIQASEAMKKAGELRRASPNAYEMSKKALGEVLQLLATDAGIDFANLPEDHPSSKKLITFSIRASPFKILEIMCEANGLTLGFDQGVWQVHPSVINAKLNSIILPRVQFTGVSIEEALEFLHAKSREFDTLDKTGVQFILRPGVTKTGRISLDLKDVPLIEALRYCTELAGLTYKVEPYAVTIAATTTEAPAKLDITAKSDAKATVTTRASKIILHSVEFRDATLVEAIEFIRAKSREHDPDKKGVNILIKGDGGTVKITLSLIDVPVPEALHYCAELADYKLSADDSTFVLAPAPPKGAAAPLKPSDNEVPETDAQAKAAELRRAKPQMYDFAKADLGDVIRFLATDAGIRFFSLPEDHPTSQRLITFSLRGSPFEVLETICKANGVVLVFHRDVWHARAVDSELVSRSYPVPATRIPVKMLCEDLSAITDLPTIDEKENHDKPVASITANGDTLHVLATRQQHIWVSGYLEAVSRAARSHKETEIKK